MIPFKHLDWNEPLGGYTKELQRFIQSTGLIEKGTFFNPIGAARVYEVIPSLKDLFVRHNLTDFHSMAVIRVLPASVAPNFPHTDVMPSPDQKIAINWPVFNCQETFTAFYEEKNDATPELVKLPNGLPYKKYKYSDVVETHRIRINLPTAIRYDILHAVVNETDRVRITASFRFISNHWELFNGQ
jgi:hypothetical protein